MPRAKPKELAKKAKKKTKKKKSKKHGAPYGSRNRAKNVLAPAHKRADGGLRRGNPTKLTPALKTMVAKLIARGYSQVKVGSIIGVSQGTISRWIVENPDLRIDIKLQESLASDMVERAVFDKAVGGTTEERKFDVDPETGKQTLIELKERTHLPDTGAAAFWLKNKRPDEWKDRQEIYNDGAITHDHRLKIFEVIGSMSPEQRIARLQELRAKRDADENQKAIEIQVK